MVMKIYCCGCEADVDARLTNGAEIYPHRVDLYSLPFWKCDACRNFVGCHYKTSSRTRPLGCIPTPEIKEARKRIHKILDSIWMNGKMARKKVYALISDMIGYEYHTAEIKSLKEAEKIHAIVCEISIQRVFS